MIVLLDKKSYAKYLQLAAKVDRSALIDVKDVRCIYSFFEYSEFITFCLLCSPEFFSGSLNVTLRKDADVAKQILKDKQVSMTGY